MRQPQAQRYQSSAPVIPAGGGSVRLALTLYGTGAFDQGADVANWREVAVAGGFRARNPGAFGAIGGRFLLASPIVALANQGLDPWLAEELLATLTLTSNGAFRSVPHIPGGCLIVEVTGAGNVADEIVDLVAGATITPQAVSVWLG
ncbi:MAG: hypothetical protein AB7I35_21665 [Ramlibacter sp.]